MNPIRLKRDLLLACLLAAPLGAGAQEGHDHHVGHGDHANHAPAAQQGHGDHGDHAGHDAHAGHDMGPRVTSGAWSYLDRDNPEPHSEGRWVMVPIPGVVAGFQFVRNVGAAHVCAGLDDHRIMVDRATREACRTGSGALPFDGVAMAADTAGQAGHHDHGGHSGDGHPVEQGNPGDHGSHAEHDHQTHADHGSHDGHDHQTHADHGSHDGHDHQTHADHNSHDGHDHQTHADDGSHTGHGHGHHGAHDGHNWMAPPEAVAMANPVQADGESVRRGEAAYRAFCMSCHGDGARGDGPAAAGLPTPPADLVTHLNHHTDGDYAWKIRTGNGAMPAFEEVLTDRQVWDLVNYLRTLAPDEQTARRHSH